MLGLGHVGAGDDQPAVGQASWQTTVLTTRRKDAPSYYNSQRLVLDRRSRPCVIFVEAESPTTDTLYFARLVALRWRVEKVFGMEHAGRAASGISGYALALDRRDQPHVFTYSSDYPTGASVFEERWTFRDGRDWQMRIIRRDNRGGRGLHDPHLAIDRQGHLHVTAYAHGYPSSHRARHRYFDGLDFRIDPLPRPPGKSDSDASDVAVDSRDTLHFVYDSKKALRRGDSEPGYPDSSLVYITRRRSQWSAPEVIRSRVGPDPQDTNYFVVSAGLTLDRRDSPHVTYAFGRRSATDPTYIHYTYRDGGRWPELDVATVPDPGDRPFRVAVSRPFLDRSGQPHFAYDHPGGTTYVHRAAHEWESTNVAGDLEGFARDPQGGIHLLTSQGPRLIYQFLPERIVGSPGAATRN
jgi:hypothetical protein